MALLYTSYIDLNWLIVTGSSANKRFYFWNGFRPDKSPGRVRAMVEIMDYKKTRNLAVSDLLK